MSGTRRGLLIALVITTGVAGVGEHLTRRIFQRRYRDAVESKRQLTLQVGEMRARTERAETELQVEQRRSHELSQALLSAHGRLEEATGRLAEEQRSVRELQGRVAAMTQQMDHLQEELARTVQGSRATAASEQAPVELDRILVSSEDASLLQGRVVSVHPEWNFMVVDLGWKAVKAGEIVSIFRQDQLLAKARVERVQEGVCAAALLPEWQTVEIHVNDLVRIL